jgi:3-hydroxybutyryl-CoA dehydratase
VDVKYYLEDLSVGMKDTSEMVITAEKIDGFAEITGDYNPIHMDEAYAMTTPFGGRIAHGALSASLISAVLGNDLPGPGAVFIELNLRFRKPAMIGDHIIATAEVAEINERTGRVKMKCRCEVPDPDGGKSKLLCRGDAAVMVAKRPEK